MYRPRIIFDLGTVWRPNAPMCTWRQVIDIVQKKKNSKYLFFQHELELFY